MSARTVRVDDNDRTRTKRTVFGPLYRVESCGMSTFELFIEKSIPNDLLLGAVSSILHIESAQIELSEHIESSQGNGLVTLVREQVGGEFVTYLSVYARRENSKVTEADFASNLSNRFSCGILFSDDDPNPYQYYLVTGDGTVKQVLLKDEPLDERGEAILC